MLKAVSYLLLASIVLSLLGIVFAVAGAKVLMAYCAGSSLVVYAAAIVLFIVSLFFKE